MPFFRFKCQTCEFSKEKLMDSQKAREHTEPCPECGGSVGMAMSRPNAIAKETKDEYRGKSVEMGVQEKILERSKEHFEKHELPRLIEKHGKEYAIRQGFVDPNKDPK